MLAGVSTACFYPELTERSFACLSGFGAQAAELFFNAPSELSDCFTKHIAKTAEASGTKILSVHPFTSGLEPLLFFSDYRRRTLDAFELYKRYFHAANVLGAKIFVLHGDRKHSQKPYHHYFDMFGELAYIGRTMGIEVAQENVPRCISYCPEFFQEMTEYLPDARFVLDTKQCIRAGYSIPQMIKAMGNRIIHVHISDHDAEHDCLPVGKGTMDIKAFLLELQKYGFDDGVILEVYRSNYGNYCELEKSYQILLNTVNQIKNG